MRYVVVCRLDECVEQSMFDVAEEINKSEWTEISSFGVADGSLSTPGDTVYKHRGFCPGHSL